MNISDQIAELFDDLRALEEKLQADLEAQQRKFQYAIRKRRVRFDTAMRQHHKTLRTTVRQFLNDSTLPAMFVSLLVYVVFIPLVILDVLLFLFQLICAPVYGIPKVKRAEYVVLDRHNLAYLNPIEKLNCVYCGYANGLLAYARAIAAQAEVHWCPIKHALKTKGTMRQYYSYADYGDAEGYRRLKDNQQIEKTDTSEEH